MRNKVFFERVTVRFTPLEMDFLNQYKEKSELIRFILDEYIIENWKLENQVEGGEKINEWRNNKEADRSI